MKTYSTSDLVRAIGDVTHAAVAEPVVITHHAKPRYVLMSIAAYERLAKGEPNPRRVYRGGEAPAALTDQLLTAIDATMAELEPGDGA
jgi:prevent-host-death family protein